MDIRVDFPIELGKRDWDDVRAWLRFLMQRNTAELSKMRFESKGTRKGKEVIYSLSPSNPRVYACKTKGGATHLVIRGLGIGGLVSDTFHLRGDGPTDSHMNTELFAAMAVAWLILIHKIISPSVSVKLDGISEKIVSHALTMAGRVRNGLEYPVWMQGLGVEEVIQRPDSMDFRA